jgi:Domain of unknown function (DUF1905)/Bacteriocin-protection, YdeI or OmpD-Associated
MKERAARSAHRHAFRAALERSDNRLWGCHVSVPLTVSRDLLSTGSRRIVCMLNSAIEYQCALVPCGSARYVITVNKQTRSRLGLGFGDEVDVVVKPDTSDYGLPFPDELREVLRQDKPGNKLFHALPPGKQRTLLYIVGKGKNRDVRIERSLTIVDHLHSNKGQIHYKLLSQSLRTGKLRVPR